MGTEPIPSEAGHNADADRADTPHPPANARKAAENLAVIRQLMERPIRYSTMSGLSGIVAGAAAVGGLLLDWHVSAAYADHPRLAMWCNVVVWGVVFLIALAGVGVMTTIRERRQGLPFWSPAKRRILATILPPFVAAVGLTVAIVYRWYVHVGPNEWGLIPPIWMAFYGVACWHVGGMSIPEIRVLGVAFIAAALPSAAFFQSWTYPYWTLGVTFGGFHVVYGLVVLKRYGG
ncbi:MAG: hypothetical protein KGY99_08545 [Phycisphaerae bacterium]|nr:hypothetical protein [Phycisphaerae bacterium]